MEIESGWLVLVLVVFYLWMTVKAYQFIRNRGPREDSSLASAGAWYLCGFLAPFMPFILVAQAVQRRRARRGIVHRANRMPEPSRER